MRTIQTLDEMRALLAVKRDTPTGGSFLMAYDEQEGLAGMIAVYERERFKPGDWVQLNDDISHMEYSGMLVSGKVNLSKGARGRVNEIGVGHSADGEPVPGCPFKTWWVEFPLTDALSVEYQLDETCLELAEEPACGQSSDG